ncbi:uncharacterized protein LOC110459777 isoform X2 [Mizuhopecten yessoensis]|uniref:uncharacterized protein LOC110459777 isoform X2 n=1 Tax=Mizuhopecten yessoensis TaxID=6573 RepID=UPI000B45F8D0|nr:uncharacterized protein LOC110459777 isoform X2 [Mizuhopecten yessoensis]
MTSLAVSLLAGLALATTSLGTPVNFDENASCGVDTFHISLGDSANVTTAGNIALGTGDCVATFLADDSENGCSDELVLCVSVEKINRMCYVTAEFTSSHKVLKLDCSIVKPPPEWCVNGNDELTLRLIQDPIKTHTDYGFVASIFARCAKYNTGQGNIFGLPAPEPEDDRVTFVDVQAAINSTRVIGIVVGVCLACMFLIALLITYFYYKNKAYTGVPSA